MDITSTKQLHNGVPMPRLGLGVYQSSPGFETEQAVRWALEAGCRHIDTAAYYGNEESVGKAVRGSGIPREEVFVTTKLRNPDHADPVRALEESIRKLDLGAVDLYLIHFPVEGIRNQSWQALSEVAERGYYRALGVSNYTVRHLAELAGVSDMVPTVNQVEFSPFLYQRELLEYCTSNNIALEAYSPLTRGTRFDDATLQMLSVKHGKTPAQILIRWCLQHDLIVIPKSVSAERIRQNAEVFDFQLTDDDMVKLDSLDEGYRVAWDPTDIP